MLLQVQIKVGKVHDCNSRYIGHSVSTVVFYSLCNTRCAFRVLEPGDFQFTNQRLFTLRGDKQNIFYWKGQAESSLMGGILLIIKFTWLSEFPLVYLHGNFLSTTKSLSKDEVLVNHFFIF